MKKHKGAKKVSKRAERMEDAGAPYDERAERKENTGVVRGAIPSSKSYRGGMPRRSAR
jgi:hypothetical protein